MKTASAVVCAVAVAVASSSLANAQELQPPGSLPPPGQAPLPGQPVATGQPQNGTQADLRQGEQDDSGLGLEWVYLTADGGFGYVNMKSFSESQLALQTTSASGGMFGFAAGIRLLFLTLGLRARDYTAFNLWQINADVGLHMRVGNLDPYLAIRGGYDAQGTSFSQTVTGATSAETTTPSISVHGWNAGLAFGMDYYFAHIISLGAEVSGDALSSPRAPRQVAPPQVTSRLRPPTSKHHPRRTRSTQTPARVWESPPPRGFTSESTSDATDPRPEIVGGGRTTVSFRDDGDTEVARGGAGAGDRLRRPDVARRQAARATMAHRSDVRARRRRIGGRLLHRAKGGAVHRTRRTDVVGGEHRRAAVRLRARSAGARGGKGCRMLDGVSLALLRRADRRHRLRDGRSARFRDCRLGADAASSPRRQRMDRARLPRALRAGLLCLYVGLWARPRQAEQATRGGLPGGLDTRDRGPRPLPSPGIRPESWRVARHPAAARRDGHRRVLCRTRI